MVSQLRYLRRREINVEQWNNCIDKAGNGLIYGYSFYLDEMAGDWDALVLQNYHAVMPLPWRRKWGFSYLYQPFLTAQLGVFGSDIDAATVAAFLAAVPAKFRYWDVSLNYRNVFAIDGWPLHLRMNYVLPLQQPYEAIYQSYRENIRRNIKKNNGFGCTLLRDIDVRQVTELSRLQAIGPGPENFTAFEQLFGQLHQKSMVKTYGIVSKTGQLLSSAVFLFSHKRAYYILVGNHPNGRTLGASHALIDAFIQDHAGQDLLLDFEGSDIRNLAFFYSSFGATEERYAAITRNRLPWWAKWLKK